MCGIFGVINKRISKEEAGRCLDTMFHRGPDAGRIHQEDVITLGHRRLAILDLSEAGIQPMTDPQGRYSIVFNGEIYNFLEIRDELKGKGYSFRTETDTEVLLCAYIEWGKECLNRLNGMWSFAVWDKEAGELFLSRDRFGVKPLYYTWLDDAHTGLAFASEMKALAPLMEKIEPNRHLVCDPALITEYESTDECIIKGISRFPAASFGVFRPEKTDGLIINRFYSTLDNLRAVPERYEEQVEEFREMFLNACEIRMRSDVTLGTALSGGLDSSATMCAMAYLASNRNAERSGRDWQHAYVAAFPGTVMDERRYAKAVTDYLGIRSTEVVVDPSKAIDRLDEMLYLFEDIYLTSPIPMMELYAALRADGTIVTLDGHGADELFGGYTFDFINALDDAGRNKKDRKMILDAYIESFPDDGSNASLRNRSYGAVEWTHRKRKFKKKLRQILGRENIPSEDDPRLDRLNNILYRSVHTNILPTLLRNYDRYSMANSIEIRMPFMDHRIVEYAFSIGWRSKLHGGYSKSIIRDALESIMPGEVVRRRTKIGFNTPVVEWMKGPLREYFTDTVNDQAFRNCDLIDPASVKNKVLRVISDPDATLWMGEQAWSALYPYLWERAFLDRIRKNR